MTFTEQVQYFDERYRIEAEYHLSQMGRKAFVWEALPERRCQFCGRSAPEVTFRKDAHAIPEFLGNRYLLNKEECDSCNDLLSETAEDHFAKFINPYRTVGQVPGKGGLPKYRTRDKRSRVEFDDDSVRVTTPQDEPIFEIDEDNRQFHLTLVTQPFIPCVAFKCFVKIALGIAPRKTLADLEPLARWMIDRDTENLTPPSTPLPVLTQFSPGPRPYDGVDVFLLRRKDEAPSAPDCVLILAFGNLCLQAYIPTHRDSELDGIKQNLVFFPTPFDRNSPYGPTLRGQMDFSGTALKKEERQRFTFKYESAVEIPISDGDED